MILTIINHESSIIVSQQNWNFPCDEISAFKFEKEIWKIFIYKLFTENICTINKNILRK